jgi:allantoicase
VFLKKNYRLDPESAQKAPWVNIIPQSPLNPGSQNLFDVGDTRSWSHVLLNIFPDGGVARLRLYGTVVPDWSHIAPGSLIDLAAIEHGGAALACSDMFFSSMNNLIMPGPPVNMGDGWETKRRRGPGHDWIIIQLGAPGKVEKVEVDTTHFKGNYPDTCSIDACSAKVQAPGSNPDGAAFHAEWKELLPVTKLAANTKHLFEKELAVMDAVTHVRLNIHPDGGVGRLRVWGRRSQS